MATWITKLDVPASAMGTRVAVKDAIDVVGVPTTAGCAALADVAEPAAADAACLAGARAAGARLVGKANLHELCFGTSGANDWYGMPVNPLDAERVPGGSSSGSAVAVATDEADVGFGTDTGGSVRIPAACCGIVGLKTTFGRVPLAGVWPLAPSLDTVGPLARDVAGAVVGMDLLEPGFGRDVAATTPATTVGRIRMGGVEPFIDEAIDDALAQAEFEVVDVELEGLADAYPAFVSIIAAEAWASNHDLVERAPDRIGEQVRARLVRSAAIGEADVASARAYQATWADAVRAAFERVPLLALPTLATLPPEIGVEGVANMLVLPFNLSGNPAISLPVPAHPSSRLPASMQLVGPHDAEALLCATAARVEAAAGLIGA